ncbi:MAG: hypothetical protein ACPL7A_02245, partial [Anaerolineales bacterium]
MALNFDIHILSLSNQVALETATTGVAGLYVETKARHAHRHRLEDHLLLQLSLIGNLTLSPEKQSQLLQRLSQVYYKTPGSVTGAMRVVAESLNHFLLERNSRAGGEENQVIGFLNQLVVHTGRVTFAQSGLTHAYWINAAGTTHLYDPELAGRGLGINKNAALCFFQSPLHAGDCLILAAQPPLSWNELFLGSLYGQGPESIRRKLAQNNLEQMEGVLIQFQSGLGKTIYLSSKPTINRSPSDVMEQTAPLVTERLVQAVESFPPQSPSIEEQAERQEEQIPARESELETESRMEVEGKTEINIPTTALEPTPTGEGIPSPNTEELVPSIIRPVQSIPSR